jgi:glycosyltransferase involved in cell wall biosynthesis
VQTSVANEGFGLVTIEAMALGKPVIGSAFGPTPELITHGENGLLVPPGDGQALASAIERLVRDPEERCRLARGARTQADRFSVRANVDAVERLYEELS